MKPKLKDDTALAEKMWWSFILSGASILSVFKFYEVTLQNLRNRNGLHTTSDFRMAVTAGLAILSSVFLIIFFFYMSARKKNNKKIEDLKMQGVKVNGKVEEIIQKGISVKYIIKASFNAPYTGEKLICHTPLLHEDPRHFLNAGSDIPIYVDGEDVNLYYIDYPYLKEKI